MEGAQPWVHPESDAYPGTGGVEPASIVSAIEEGRAERIQRIMDTAARESL